MKLSGSSIAHKFGWKRKVARKTVTKSLETEADLDPGRVDRQCAITPGWQKLLQQRLGSSVTYPWNLLTNWSKTPNKMRIIKLHIWTLQSNLRNTLEWKKRSKQKPSVVHLGLPLADITLADESCPYLQVCKLSSCFPLKAQGLSYKCSQVFRREAVHLRKRFFVVVVFF